MKTWTDYKEHVKSSNTTDKKSIEEMETLATIISAMVQQRNALELSQRDLASLCGIPQSRYPLENYATAWFKINCFFPTVV